MEFSEAFELRRIAGSRKSHGDYSPFTRIVKSHNSLHPADVSPVFSYDFVASPEFPNQTNDDSSLKESSKFSTLKIERDTSYLEQSHIKKRSSLLFSLQQPENSERTSPLKQLDLDIYFFHSLNKVKLTVPKEITVSDMMTKALQAYIKTSYPNLPHGVNSEAYDVWLTVDDGYLPDTDYPIDRDSFVATLAVSSLCICEKPGFRSSIFTVNNGLNILKHTNKTGMLYAKFYFENSSAIVAVNPDAKLSEILVVLWKKFFIFGELQVGMFEFRIFIEETGNECELDMSLRFKEIPKADIRLYRKVLADTPKGSNRRNHKSQVLINGNHFNFNY